MARTDLRITLATPDELIIPICRAAGLKGKEVDEVYHSLDAVRLWGDRFERLHGALLGCVHHSNPDDPPDMALRFADSRVEVEHTRLETSTHGWMKALHREVCPQRWVNVPPVSFRAQGREELLSAMLASTGHLSDPRTSRIEGLRHCLGAIQRKIEDRPEGILVLQDGFLFFEGDLRPVAEHLHALLSPQPRLIRGWTIILHSRCNPIQYNSYIIATQEDLQHRANRDAVRRSSRQAGD